MVEFDHHLCHVLCQRVAASHAPDFSAGVFHAARDRWGRTSKVVSNEIRDQSSHAKSFHAGRPRLRQLGGQRRQPPPPLASLCQTPPPIL